jgi:hypothetical protein
MQPATSRVRSSFADWCRSYAASASVSIRLRSLAFATWSIFCSTTSGIAARAASAASARPGRRLSMAGSPACTLVRQESTAFSLTRSRVSFSRVGARSARWRVRYAFRSRPVVSVIRWAQSVSTGSRSRTASSWASETAADVTSRSAAPHVRRSRRPTLLAVRDADSGRTGPRDGEFVIGSLPSGRFEDVATEPA